MAKKDLTSAIQGIVNTNISPVQKLFGASTVIDDVKKIEEKTENESVSKTNQTISKRVGRGRPVGAKKSEADLKTNTIVHYFSDNELKNIDKAGITQRELSTILRLRLKEMGVNISIK